MRGSRGAASGPTYNVGMHLTEETCPIATQATRREPRATAPQWMSWTLVAAGIYNLTWGTVIVLMPSQPFAWLGMEQPNYPELWQCVGMVVGVYGVGYWIAAYDPARHWPIVLVGWLGKVLGPIGFVNAAMTGALPWSFGLVNVLNDLVWLGPFTAILLYAWRANSAPSVREALSLDEAIHNVRSHRGRTIAELSSTASSPRPTVGALHTRGVLVLFIRHAGCTFCREALAELAAARDRLEAQGLALAVVHMSQTEPAATLLSRYGLSDIDHFSDPDCRLFRAFSLSRGSLWQVLGPAVWRRGLAALVKHGIGKPTGDGFQLGGAFIVRDGQIMAAQRLATSAERVDFAALVQTQHSARQEPRPPEPRPPEPRPPEAIGA